MMPRSAIATGVADFVAPIARLVERHGRGGAQQGGAAPAGEADGDEATCAASSPSCTRGPGTTSRSYKRATVLRRVARRMQVTRKRQLAGTMRDTSGRTPRRRRSCSPTS